ncbi:hypothetical protein GGS21DRAFT_135 [Xylaria nigripes]|nr:hypothetical protein GGS21DRAFT_135 [Xylaria nigripes]
MTMSAIEAHTQPGLETATPGLELAEYRQYQGGSYNSADRMINNSPWPPDTKTETTPPLLESREKKRKWFGVIAVTAAVTAVIVGAAVGGGVGASLASAQRSLKSSLSSCQRDLSGCRAGTPTSSSNSTPFTTNKDGLILDYVVEPARNIYNVSVDCASLDNQVYTTSKNENFMVYCDVNFGSGDLVDKDGKSVILADIIAMTAYSLTDCLQACSQFTAHSKKWDVDNECGAVTFAKNMATHADGNCWLKNSTIRHTAGAGRNVDAVSATKIS